MYDYRLPQIRTILCEVHKQDGSLRLYTSTAKENDRLFLQLKSHRSVTELLKPFNGFLEKVESCEDVCNSLSTAFYINIFFDIDDRRVHSKFYKNTLIKLGIVLSQLLGDKIQFENISYDDELI